MNFKLSLLVLSLLNSNKRGNAFVNDKLSSELDQSNLELFWVAHAFAI